MKPITKKISAGTHVKLAEGWYVVKDVHPTRQWINVYGLEGSFQRGHIQKFTNRAVA